MPKPTNTSSQNAKEQAKKEAIALGKKKAEEKKKNKAVTNLNAYQTRHKNQAIQQQREQTAREYGLPGHASGAGSSKKNRATTQGLKRINRKSP